MKRITHKAVNSDWIVTRQVLAMLARWQRKCCFGQLFRQGYNVLYLYLPVADWSECEARHCMDHSIQTDAVLWTHPMYAIRATAVLHFTAVADAEKDLGKDVLISYSKTVVRKA